MFDRWCWWWWWWWCRFFDKHVVHREAWFRFLWLVGEGRFWSGWRGRGRLSIVFGCDVQFMFMSMIVIMLMLNEGIRTRLRDRNSRLTWWNSVTMTGARYSGWPVGVALELGSSGLELDELWRRSFGDCPEWLEVRLGSGSKRGDFVELRLFDAAAAAAKYCRWKASRCGQRWWSGPCGEEPCIFMFNEDTDELLFDDAAAAAEAAAAR